MEAVPRDFVRYWAIKSQRSNLHSQLLEPVINENSQAHILKRAKCVDPVLLSSVDASVIVLPSKAPFHCIAAPCNSCKLCRRERRKCRETRPSSWIGYLRSSIRWRIPASPSPLEDQRPQPVSQTCQSICTRVITLVRQELIKLRQIPMYSPRLIERLRELFCIALVSFAERRTYRYAMFVCQHRHFRTSFAAVYGGEAARARLARQSAGGLLLALGLRRPPSPRPGPWGTGARRRCPSASRPS